MFCVKKSLRIATVLYIYIKEEKRNEEYRVQVVKLENLNF